MTNRRALFTAFGLLWGLAAAACTAAEVPAIQVGISAEAKLDEVARIGLNLGQWTSWGAEQLSRNVLKNPGFEGVVDRSLVRATRVGRHGFSDDQRWLGRADGFWASAEFTVLTGLAAGHQGRVLDSRQTGADGLPEFSLQTAVEGLREGDIIALKMENDLQPPERWWLPEAGQGEVRVNPDLRRPDSPGRRSLGLHPLLHRPLVLHSHLDTLSERAGKLLPVQGRWRFSIWVHGQADEDAELRLRFHRHGSPAFFDHRLSVQPGWQEQVIEFLAADDGPPGALELRIELSGGVVHLDDAWLGPALEGSAEATRLAEARFNPALIELLRQLQPGYLRDWQGQLGDSLDNRLAEPFARRTSRYRPGHSDFHYGLPEFIDLCDLLGAHPWLVMPTTFSVEEAYALGQWLAVQIAHYGFDEIVVEFGNENWNAIFRPAGIQDPERHGQAADRLFAALKAGAGDHPALQTAINAQHANPHAALRFARASRYADLLGLAPYFLNRADQADRGQLLARLFEDDGGRLDQILEALDPNQAVAVYEINLHTTRGDLAADERAELVSSPAAGIALAWHLLGQLERGIRRQNVYRAIGFDSFLEDRSALTPLFGVARELGPPATLRTTGQALALLNSVIGGDFHALQGPGMAGGTLRGGAFRHPEGWTVLLAHAGSDDIALELSLPGGPVLSLKLPGVALKQIDCRRPTGSVEPAQIGAERCSSQIMAAQPIGP